MTTTTEARPSLHLCLIDDPRPDLDADARRLAGAFLAHALGTAGPLTVPAGRSMRRQHLANWSRNRYAAAMRALIDAGLYRQTQHPDGHWTVHVVVPRGAR